MEDAGSLHTLNPVGYILGYLYRVLTWLLTYGTYMGIYVGNQSVGYRYSDGKIWSQYRWQSERQQAIDY